MAIICEKFTVNSRGFNDIIDLTTKVEDIVAEYSIKDAQVFIYVPGSTASVTTIEYEPGLVKDLPEALEKFAPMDKLYYHDKTWHDGNGYAHVRASIVGNSTIIPIINTRLQLGTWQQIILIDYDNKPRTRNIIVQIFY
ncbi:MAG: secondary thiamine-phosphate synthase enzyme YjbQ [Candidatus Gastranaerophilales bacterium]|nr:secondary thiamine-phosphate synthase enzyme YjbQ [Candidatus Gastranaerophilales bacterium]